MARGWESKSVESQIESAVEMRRAAAAAATSSSVEQIGKQREREGLELSRRRVLNDLEAAKNPRYREQLKAALRYLDEKLGNLG